MKISHLNNSFIVIEGSGTKLVCDPWTGISNYGTWHSLPIFEAKDVVGITADTDYVYISHLHADHLDPDTLKFCDLLDARFVINKNNEPTLKRRLEMLGASEVIECEPFTVIDLGELKIATVPQMSQNTAGLDFDVDYDLDSSILASDGRAVFFNQVDNPLSVEDMRYIGEWSRTHFGQIDLAALTCGAASEYPQCFMNIDRAAEKERVEKASIDMLLKRLDALKPRNMCLGGGSYFIPGRNAPLNAYIAVPEAHAVKSIVKTAIPDICFYELEGGAALTIDQVGVPPTQSQNLEPIYRDLNAALAVTCDISYAQENVHIDEIDEVIDRVLPLATMALQDRLAADKFRMKAQLRFALHERLTLDDAGNLISEAERTIDLALAPENPDQSLVLHLDKVMFAQLICGKMIWNLVVSGSQIMYERSPNVFHPTDTAALNFFVHREKR